LRVGVGLRRGFPFRFTQPRQQRLRLARHDDELAAVFQISGHGIPTVEPGIHPREEVLHARRKRPEGLVQMLRYLFARRPVPIAQPAG